MIKSISIKNIALIENLEIDFKDGLNIITGETGAGKSILLGAISLILGSKGGVDIIRSGSERASVEIEFDISKSKQLKSLLVQSGIESEDDVLIIKRELISDGRNNCFVNLNRINVSNLKDFGELLVDITSQHQHQSLLRVSNHIYLLDNYSELDNKREQFSKTYKQYKELTLKLNNLIEKKDEQKKRLEYNKFVINEIEDAKFYINEDVELEQQLLYLSNFQKLKDNLFEVCNFSYHNENAVIPSLHKIIDFLSKAGTVDSKVENSTNIVQEVLYKMEEVFDFIKNKYDDLEFSQDTLDSVINRLEQIKSFKKRYGNSIEEIFSFKEKCEKEAIEITFNQQQIEEVNQQISELENILKSEAIALSTQRQSSAKQLEKLIEQELSFLGMHNSTFKIEFHFVSDEDSFLQIKEHGIKVDENGIDKIEFMFSANKGEEIKPLIKIISGGELSRVMLAIKSILAKSDEIDTLLFDEVDAGIGGETAFKVGKKIRDISQDTQVICITHSPQIAGFSDHHYLAQKREIDGRTKTSIVNLSHEEKIHEVARMLGGNDITSLSIEHAKELLGKVNE